MSVAVCVNTSRVTSKQRNWMHIFQFLKGGSGSSMAMCTSNVLIFPHIVTISRGNCTEM
jgi:hypothetical protein